MGMDKNAVTDESSSDPTLHAGGDLLVIPLDGGDALDNKEDLTLKLYGFCLGEIGFLLESDIRREVVEDVPVTPIPLMPDYVLGLSNIRGNLVPVYDLYDELGVERINQDNQKKRILFLGENEEMFGISIQDLLVSLQFNDFDLIEKPPLVHEKINNCFKFCYRKDDNYWFGIDYQALIESL